MTKQESIKYISSLINAPATITEGDKSSIALFRQRFPYFVPMRYLIAYEDHKREPWSPAMLSAMQPYMGNWMLFCDFMEAGSGAGAFDINEQAGMRAPYDEEAETQQASDEITNETIEEEGGAETLAETLIADEIEETAITEALYDQPFTNDGMAEEQVNVTEETYYAEEAPVYETVIVETVINEDAVPGEAVTEEDEPEPLITPIHFQDYFLHEGIRISEEIPGAIEELKQEPAEEDVDKGLMVMMSFSEWLLHFKNVAEKQKEEVKDRKALRTMWQKEKLAAAMEEENEEIPENVFEMAVNSITPEDGLVSETLADIYIKQGKYDKAIEVYRKLSLRNRQKSVYFARKIDEVLKDKQS